VIEGENPNYDRGTSHETAISAIIAATVGNGIGIRGGAPGVSIHSVFATLPGPLGPTIYCLEGAEALELAGASYGSIHANVINMSYGGYEYCQTQKDVIGGLLPYVLVVAPTGNDQGPVAYPAAYFWTVAVSATNSDNRLWPSSNVGPEVDIAAGGERITTLAYNGSWITRTGTRYAAPHVTAAIALLIGRKIVAEGCVPDYWEILDALGQSATVPEPPYHSEWYGAGILDAAGAIDSAAAQPQAICLWASEGGAVMPVCRLLGLSLALAGMACGENVGVCDAGSPLLSLRDSLTWGDSVAAWDWRPEAERLLATAPPDSTIKIGVGLYSQGWVAFGEWVRTSPEVTITYAFRTIPAFAITLPIRALAGMIRIQGIAYVDWNHGPGATQQECL
jgi:Subtilase family